MKKSVVILLVLVTCLLSLATASATKKQAGLLPEDFAYKGLALGDTAEKMQQVLGEPDFDTTLIVLDQSVKGYIYSADLKVCVDPRTEKVVAIIAKDKNYQAHAGVTYGSTRAKLKNVYGSYDKLKRDGDIYYYYRNPDDEHQKLMFIMETTNYYVQSFLYTSLPLTEEEEAEYDMGEFPTDLGGEDISDDDDRFSGGFSSRDGWWANYRVNDNITIGI